MDTYKLFSKQALTLSELNRSIATAGLDQVVHTLIMDLTYVYLG